MGSTCFSCGNGKNRVIVVKPGSNNNDKTLNAPTNLDGKEIKNNKNLLKSDDILSKEKELKESVLVTIPHKKPQDSSNSSKKDNNLKKEVCNSQIQDKRTTNMITVGEKEEAKSETPLLNVDKYYSMINQIDDKKKEELKKKKKNSMKNGPIDVTKYMNMIEKIEKNKKIASNN